VHGSRFPRFGTCPSWTASTPQCGPIQGVWTAVLWAVLSVDSHGCPCFRPAHLVSPGEYDTKLVSYLLSSITIFYEVFVHVRLA
jgi:hypothetical protein